MRYPIAIAAATILTLGLTACDSGGHGTTSATAIQADDYTTQNQPDSNKMGSESSMESKSGMHNSMQGHSSMQEMDMSGHSMKSESSGSSEQSSTQSQ